jgi:hypothetical protein
MSAKPDFNLKKAAAAAFLLATQFTVIVEIIGKIPIKFRREHSQPV